MILLHILFNFSCENLTIFLWTWFALILFLGFKLKFMIPIMLFLQDLKINFDHPKLTGEQTVQNAITEVAVMTGENVKLGGGFAISAPSYGVLSTYLHTSPIQGN